MVVIADEDRAAVGRPDRALHVAVERWGQDAARSALAVDHDQLAVLVAAPVVVKAGKGDPAAIGGDDGARRRAVMLGQRGDFAASDIDAVDVADASIALPFGRAVGREHDRSAVGAPARRALVVDRTEADLPRRTTIGGDDEQMRIAGLQIPLVVAAIGRRGDHLQRVGPFRALGLGRGGAELGALVGHRHRISDLAPVGGPGEARRRVGQAGDPRAFAPRKPRHRQLRTAALGGR